MLQYRADASLGPYRSAGTLYAGGCGARPRKYPMKTRRGRHRSQEGISHQVELIEDLGLIPPLCEPFEFDLLHLFPPPLFLLWGGGEEDEVGCEEEERLWG